MHVFDASFTRSLPLSPRRRLVTGLCYVCRARLTPNELTELLAALDLAAEHRHEQQADREKAEKRRRLEEAQSILERLPPFQSGGSSHSPLFLACLCGSDQSDLLEWQVGPVSV